jgi:hypothetical protein
VQKIVVAAAAASVLLATAAGTARAADAPTPPPQPPAVLPAQSPLAWGVADDFSKYADDGGAWFDAQLKGANLSENRWTLTWDPANPTAIEELPFLERAAPVARAAGVHVVLALYGKDPKQHDPTAFCAWAASVATTVSAWGIHDYIVWNEPNGPLYWQPQKSARGRDLAAPAYLALLATCYDALHAVDAEANVIGMGLAPRASQKKKANEPLAFLRDVGAAYRLSGRTAPIMDQLALHPYPNPNSSVPGAPPSKGYAGADQFGIPDLDRVKQAVYDAFAGTGQPTAANGLTFRLDEVGWQTDTTAYPQYVGAENARPPGAPAPVSEAAQASFLAAMARSYFACDPTVTDVELFLLVDEKYRNGHDENGTYLGGGWQSGLLTAGGPGVSQPKLAYTALAPIFGAGRAACARGVVAWTPGATPHAPKGGGTSTKGRVKRCVTEHGGRRVCTWVRKRKSH